MTDAAIVGTKDGNLDMVRCFDVMGGNLSSWDEDRPKT